MAEYYDDAAEAIPIHPDILLTKQSQIKACNARQPQLHGRSVLRNDVLNPWPEFNNACLKGSAVSSPDIKYRREDMLNPKVEYKKDLEGFGQHWK